LAHEGGSVIPICTPLIGSREKIAVLDILDSGMIAQGECVKEFENKWAEYHGVRYAIAVSSGTAALHLALLAHRIGPGDEVITTPFSFIASSNAILMTGARPVFADIDPATYNIAPSYIPSLITRRTKAILPVHLYGYPANMDAISEIAEEHRLPVIEDSCQAIGASIRGKKVGTFGTGCFSLYATKNITTGEGGMITTNDDEINRQCRLLRHHGMSQPYIQETFGYNYRMTDIAAAIGLVQLSRLDHFTRTRIRNAAFYLSRLDNVTLPFLQEGHSHVFHQFTIRVKNRNQAAARLKNKGVGTGIYYQTPIHMQPFYRSIAPSVFAPEAEKAGREVLSIPVHPALTVEEREHVAKAVNSL